MPLKPGKSQKTISSNIRELHSGNTFAKTKQKFGKEKANKQAVAIAMDNARRTGKGQAHPGFKAVQAKIAKKEGISGKSAGAILANSSRNASPAAKRSNPFLKRVGGGQNRGALVGRGQDEAVDKPDQPDEPEATATDTATDVKPPPDTGEATAGEATADEPKKVDETAAGEVTSGPAETTTGGVTPIGVPPPADTTTGGSVNPIYTATAAGDTTAPVVPPAAAVPPAATPAAVPPWQQGRRGRGGMTPYGPPVPPADAAAWAGKLPGFLNDAATSHPGVAPLLYGNLARWGISPDNAAAVPPDYWQPYQNNPRSLFFPQRGDEGDEGNRWRGPKRGFMGRQAGGPMGIPSPAPGSDEGDEGDQGNRPPLSAPGMDAVWNRLYPLFNNGATPTPEQMAAFRAQYPHPGAAFQALRARVMGGGEPGAAPPAAGTPPPVTTPVIRPGDQGGGGSVGQQLGASFGGQSWRGPRRGAGAGGPRMIGAPPRPPQVGIPENNMPMGGEERRGRGSRFAGRQAGGPMGIASSAPGSDES